MINGFLYHKYVISNYFALILSAKIELPIKDFSHCILKNLKQQSNVITRTGFIAYKLFLYLENYINHT